MGDVKATSHMRKVSSMVLTHGPNVGVQAS